MSRDEAVSRSRGPAASLRRMHRVLLPDDPAIGWTPYLWLAYLAFFYVSWIGRPPGGLEAGLGVLTLGTFLVLYFSGYRRPGTAIVWNIVGLLLLGMAWAPTRPSAMVFFIYAVGFCGAVGPPRLGARILVASILLSALFGHLVGLGLFWILITATMQGIIGLTNIYFAELGRKNADLRLSREEAEHLAAMAERERIARDLHDLLGHTLSLITLKAELAGKLSRRGDPRAGDEIADVERISRDALRQVREAVSGFRPTGLEAELGRASVLCRARGIDLEAELEDLDLETRQESTLMMVLREAITNLVRHSGASQAVVRLRRRADGQGAPEVVLTVQDDGRGGAPAVHGTGLKGMAERLAGLGGHLRVDGAEGWRVEARLPFTHAVAPEGGS